MKIQFAIQAFLQNRHARNLKPRTIQWYKTDLSRFSQFCPDLPTEPGPLEEFLDSLPGTPETRHGYYRSLKALYRFISKRYRFANPIELIDPPRCPKKIMPTLEAQEIMRLLNSVSDLRDRTLLTLLVDTGARVSEVTSLLKQGIKADSIQVTGKTGQREIPISDETRRLLLTLISTNGKSELVFSSQGGKPYSRHSVYRLIRNLMKQAGILGPKLGPHRIRHAFGKGYLVNGGDIRSLQLILGHANITTTEKYASLNLNDIVVKHHKFTPLRAAHAAAQENFFDTSQALKEAEAIVAGVK